MKTCIIIPWFNFWRTSNKIEFSSLLKNLKMQGYNALLFDYEERPDNLDDLLIRLDNLIKKTNSKDITLIGFSLGSYLSIKYIKKYHDPKVKNIILCIPLVLGSVFFRTIYRLMPFWKRSTGSILYQASYEKLNISNIKDKINIKIIRGTKRINRRFISILSQFILLFNNDGLFRVSETDFGKYEKISLPIGHYEAPQNKILICTICNLIKDQ
jgi:hypothetical protein